MTQHNNLPAQSIFNVSLSRKMIIGAGIGLILISIFLIGVKNPDASWGEYWMIRPLLMLSFAGAMSGLVFHVMNHYRKFYGWNTALINIVSFIICFIGMWMGFVLGLVGTLWH